jgi:hypothetical protein
MLVFGLTIISIGVFLTVKNWDVGWDEMIRVVGMYAQDRRAYFKWVGFSFIAVGIVALLAAFGII